MPDDELEENIEKKFSKLAEELRDRERIANDLRNLIERRIADESISIQRLTREELKSSVEDHRKHIESLYTKFERIVWFALVLIGGTVAFQGYQSIVDIPKKLEAAIAKAGEAQQKEVVLQQLAYLNLLKEVSNNIISFRDGVNSISVSATNDLRQRIQNIDAYISGETIRINQSADEISKSYQSQIANLLNTHKTNAQSASQRTYDEFNRLTNLADAAFFRITDTITSNALSKVEGLTIDTDRKLKQISVEEDLNQLDPNSVAVSSRFQRLIAAYGSQELMTPATRARFLRILTRRRPMPELKAGVQQIVQNLSTNMFASLDDYEATRFRLGMWYEVPDVVKDIKSKIQVSSPSSQVLSLFDKIDGILAPEGYSTMLYLYKPETRAALAQFADELVKLTSETTNIVVGTRSARMLAAAQNNEPSPLCSLAIARFLETLGNEPSFPDGFIDLIQTLPIDKKIFDALFLILKNNYTNNEYIFATASYLKRMARSAKLDEDMFSKINNAPEVFKAIPSVKALIENMKIRSSYRNTAIIQYDTATNQNRLARSGFVFNVNKYFPGTKYKLISFQFLEGRGSGGIQAKIAHDDTPDPKTVEWEISDDLDMDSVFVESKSSLELVGKIQIALEIPSLIDDSKWIFRLRNVP